MKRIWIIMLALALVFTAGVKGQAAASAVSGYDYECIMLACEQS